MFDLSSQKAIVVGGAGGIGLAICEGLMECGAKVSIIDMDNRLSNEVDKFIAKGFNCSGFKADISIRSEIKESFEQSISELDNEVHILINAAGIQRRTSSEKFSESDWDDVLSINLTSVFLYSQLAAQNMLQRGYGKIVNLCSIMSNFGGIRIPAYAASKGGVAQLTKAMSNDLAPRGICVNAIAPGYIATSMNEEIFHNAERNNEILSRTPIGRWGRPDDLKGIVIFLASRASDFVTGTVIPIDGGYSSR